MKTILALIIKFLATMAAAWIAFMIFGTAALWTVALVALVATVLNYLIGDMLILPRSGNVIASLIDGILGGATAWLILTYASITYTFMGSVYLFALIVVLAEFFFHMYLLTSHIIVRKKTDADLFKKARISYNTETGSELYPYNSRKNKRGL